MKYLLITSIFPPINGGSAVVYEKIAEYCADHALIVLAPKRHCATNEWLEGWQQYDSTAPFQVVRTTLLRPLVVVSKSRLQSLYLFLCKDIPLYLKILRLSMKLIKQHDIKVVCIGELNSLGWLGIALKRLLGIKLICYIHGEEVTTDTPYRNFSRNRKHYLKHADALVAVSKFTRDYLINGFRVPEDKITLIPNGVDLNVFAPAEKSAALLQRYNLQHKKIMLTVGRLVPRKGIDKTLEAMPAIIKAVPDVHYLIVGIGPYQDKLKQLVQQYNLQDYVTFTGKISQQELVQHYQLCDVFIMANRTMPDGDTEGFGLVFLEANACGKPVVGGKAGGAVEAVQHGYNGLSVNGYQSAEIADAVTLLLTDDAKYQQISQNGLALVQQCRFERCAERFDQLCKQLSGKIDG
ncbi:glycosyltransferase family 4 protein [Rheinheimera sp.]|uniref:glycosyltransferase family 4 protein n=1 Tax=Rheinheimera sp. TaxID=1869214 RepID=UPI004048B4D5